MKQLFNDSIKNFNTLMVNMGKQFLFALIYISVGIGYAGVNTGKSPADLIAGRQDVLIVMMFSVPISMAIFVTAVEPLLASLFVWILNNKKQPPAQETV